jgi:tRNA1Val (adenine37-N6)-methyltransferase
MSSLGFQLKQCFIEHTGCAMKVGTDSLMLGSWAEPATAKTILDVGTGSGLLALMLAQRASIRCKIIGIDIVPEAIKQAKKNAGLSPWSAQCEFHQTSFQTFTNQALFDLIVSNPPYFTENATANQVAGMSDRTLARQTLSLGHRALFENVERLLSEAGSFCCVLPADAYRLALDIAHETGLYCNQVVNVRSLPETKVIRHLLRFSRINTVTEEEELAIYQSAGHYSEQYRTLCKEYYLNF